MGESVFGGGIMPVLDLRHCRHDLPPSVLLNRLLKDMLVFLIQYDLFDPKPLMRKEERRQSETSDASVTPVKVRKKNKNRMKEPFRKAPITRYSFVQRPHTGNFSVKSSNFFIDITLHYFTMLFEVKKA